MIHKYELTMDARQELILPADAEILSVQNQRDRPVMWAIHKPGEKKEVRVIRVITTGNGYQYPASLVYLNTVQFYDGSLVMHFFEELV